MLSPFTHRLRNKPILLAAALLLSIALFAHSMTTSHLFFLRRHTSTLRIHIADGLITLEFHQNAGNSTETSFFHTAIPSTPQSAAAALAAITLCETHFSLTPQSLNCKFLGCDAFLARPTDAAFQLPLWIIPALLTFQLLRHRPRSTPRPFEILTVALASRQ